MINETKLGKYDLKKSSEIPPKEKGGLNIEALCANLDGYLLIGFRNPIPNGKALIIPFLNPKEVVMEGHKAEFDKPMELELDGLGIRSMEYFEFLRYYIIVAGPYFSSECSSDFKIFKWSGKPTDSPLEITFSTGLADNFNPEAIVVFSNIKNRVLLISDDGSIKRKGKKPCKKLKHKNENKYFRSIWINFESIKSK